MNPCDSAPSREEEEAPPSLPLGAQEDDEALTAQPASFTILESRDWGRSLRVVTYHNERRYEGMVTLVESLEESSDESAK